MVKQKDVEEIQLAEPPDGSLRKSEILAYTKKDFFNRTWTLRCRWWTVLQLGDFLAFCFYNPLGEPKLSKVVPLDSENKSWYEMFKYFFWWIFTHESKLIDVKLDDETPEKQPAQNVKRLTGKRTNIKEVS